MPQTLTTNDFKGTVRVVCYFFYIFVLLHLVDDRDNRS